MEVRSRDYLRDYKEKEEFKKKDEENVNGKKKFGFPTKNK